MRRRLYSKKKACERSDKMSKKPEDSTHLRLSAVESMGIVWLGLLFDIFVLKWA